MMRRLSSAATLLAALLGVVRCTPRLEDIKPGCESLADCPLAHACDLTQGACIDLPPDRVLGRFQCTVGEQGETAPAPGTSEVTGRFQQRPLNLLSAAECQLQGDDLVLFFVGVNANGAYPRLRLAVPGGRGLVSGQVADIAQAAGVFSTVVNPGVAGVASTASPFGVSGSGRLQLRGAAARGQALEGYLDLSVSPVCSLAEPDCPGDLSCVDLFSEQPTVGACLRPVDGPCDTAAGRYCPQGQLCLRPTADASEGLCQRRCDANVACPAGLTCAYILADKTRGVCQQGAGRHEPCGQAGVSCLAGDTCYQNSSGQGYCAGPDCTLGAPGACGAGESCLTNGGDSSGLCDQPPPVFGACNPPRWLFCANDQTCIRFDEDAADGRCTLACTQDADCPAGHPCSTELQSGAFVCTP